MIKFKCLIHKETGTVIQYEDWLKEFKRSGYVDAESGNPKYHKQSYVPVEGIFSDDFTIVYDSEFTTEETDKILHGIGLVADESRYDEEQKPIYKSILTKVNNQCKNDRDIVENIEWLIKYFE